MYKILKAFFDAPFCSFEFLNLDTQEHIFADYFDDPFYELLKECRVTHYFELEGKVIEKIPSDLFQHNEEYAIIRAQQPYEGYWLYPWLKKKQAVSLSEKKVKKR
jgi:hypothetical protein